LEYNSFVARRCSPTSFNLIVRQHMSLPFHVSCAQESPLLYELPNDCFRQMTPGLVEPFVAGYQFLLVDAALAQFLARLDIESITYRPATIVDPRASRELRTHTRVVVQQFFRAPDILDIPTSGLRILTLEDRYYFVSPALKVELEKGGFHYLRFAEGLSQFAGHAA
jgi:hypothetical protein